MEYVQITNGEALQITTHGNVKWDDTHYCPASALTSEEAVQFDVHPLLALAPPAYNPQTHSVIRDGCEFVDNQWQYKWRIDELTPEQIEQRRLASIPQEISRAQFILALLQVGLLDEVELAIANADKATQINYKERLTFKRDFPLVTTMAQALGKTDVEIDNLFILGATL